jgi:hypothetical protein
VHPLVQFVIVQLCAPLHVSEQSPPAQSIEHEPLVQLSEQFPSAQLPIEHSCDPLQFCRQSPWAQLVMSQVVPPEQLCMQSPPLQSVIVQDDPEQFELQSPLAHASEQVAPPAQS